MYARIIIFLKAKNAQYSIYNKEIYIANPDITGPEFAFARRLAGINDTLHNIYGDTYELHISNISIVTTSIPEDAYIINTDEFGEVYRAISFEVMSAINDDLNDEKETTHCNYYDEDDEDYPEFMYNTYSPETEEKADYSKFVSYIPDYDDEDDYDDYKDNRIADLEDQLLDANLRVSKLMGIMINLLSEKYEC